MSSKPSKKPKNTVDDQEEPIAKRKTFNIIYTIIMLISFIVGVLLLILSNAVFKSDVVFFIGLGIIGLGIVLLTQRSVYQQTGGTVVEPKNKEDKESLKLRERR